MFDPDEKTYYHACLGCGKLVTWRFAICQDCEKMYSNKATEWPKWLREKWNLEQCWRRKRVRAREKEIHFTDVFHYTWKNLIFENENAQLDSIILKRFFLGLPKRIQEILGLKSKGYTQKEIGNFIGISRTSVGTIINQVKQQLQEQELF